MTINFHFHKSCSDVWTQVLTVVSHGGRTCAQEKRGESHPPERPHVSPRTRGNSVEAGWIAPSAESSTTLHTIYPLWAVLHLKQNCCIPSETTCHHRHEHRASPQWNTEHVEGKQQGSKVQIFRFHSQNGEFILINWFFSFSLRVFFHPQDKTGALGRVKTNRLSQIAPSTQRMLNIWQTSAEFVP